MTGDLKTKTIPQAKAGLRMRIRHTPLRGVPRSVPKAPLRGLRGARLFLIATADHFDQLHDICHLGTA